MNACFVYCDWLRAWWFLALCAGLLVGAVSRPQSGPANQPTAAAQAR